MWLAASSQQQAESKKQKTEHKPERQAENLDFRLRQLEGETPTFFLGLEKTSLLEELTKATNNYDAQKPGKGKPHPLGHRKCAVAGALLLHATTFDLAQLPNEQTMTLATEDAILTALGRPTHAKQKEVLLTLYGLLKTPQEVEHHVHLANFWKAKRETKYVLSVSINKHSVLMDVWPYLQQTILSSGATPATGAPPKGPLFR